MDKFVYILDGNNKIIHTIANVSEACGIDDIKERHDVNGLNQAAVDKDKWLYCRHCIDAKKSPARKESKPGSGFDLGSPSRDKN